MKEWKVILATLVIFAAGVVTGGLLVNHSVKPRNKPANPGNKLAVRGPAYETRFQYLRLMEQQLDLTPEQREKIDRLLSDSQLRAKGIWDATQPKINEEMKRVKDQIREQLNVEQRKKFDDLNKRPSKKESKKEQRKEKEMQRTNSPNSQGSP